MLTQFHTEPLDGADSHHPYGVRSSVVERRIVAAKAVGSTPIAPPKTDGVSFN